MALPPFILLLLGTARAQRVLKNAESLYKLGKITKKVYLDHLKKVKSNTEIANKQWKQMNPSDKTTFLNKYSKGEGQVKVPGAGVEIQPPFITKLGRAVKRTISGEKSAPPPDKPWRGHLTKELKYDPKLKTWKKYGGTVRKAKYNE